MGPSGCGRPSGGDDEKDDSGIQISAGYSQIWSHLHFDTGYEPTVNQQAVAGSVGYFWSSGWSLHAGGGIVLGGTIEGEGLEFELGQGWLASVRAGKRLLQQKGPIPFMNMSLALSFSMNRVSGGIPEEADWISSDVRLNLTAGYTLFDFWQLYLSPKLFGGPIFWEQEDGRSQGRDRYFFQAGVGTAFLLPFGLTVFAEGSPLGEQAISAGAALTF